MAYPLKSSFYLCNEIGEHVAFTNVKKVRAVLSSGAFDVYPGHAPLVGFIDTGSLEIEYSLITKDGFTLPRIHHFIIGCGSLTVTEEETTPGCLSTIVSVYCLEFLEVSKDTSLRTLSNEYEKGKARFEKIVIGLNPRGCTPIELALKAKATRLAKTVELFRQAILITKVIKNCA